MVGVLIPLGHARALNQWFTGRRALSYNAAYVKLGDLRAFDQVSSSIRTMGYVVESQGETLDKFITVARVGMLGIALFCGLIAALAGIAVFNTYSLALMLRRPEILLLRAIGATRRFVLCLVLMDALLIGIVAGILGGGAAVLTLDAIHSLLMQLIANLSLIPSVTKFSNWTIWTTAVLMGTGLALATSLPLAWRSGSLALSYAIAVEE